MQLNFDNIDVAVNRTGVLANSVTVNSSNAISPAYVVGYRKPVKQLPLGSISSTFNLSYYPDIDAEPNLAIANRIKNLSNDTYYNGEKVEVAGITNNYCFLTSYSMKISPNNIIEANATYTTYSDLCGDVRSKNNLIDYFHSGNICHSWQTFLNSGDFQREIYEINYDLQVNWKPVYTIGNKFPNTVKLINGSESLSFDINEYRNIQYTGESIYPNIFSESDGNMYLKNLSLMCRETCQDSDEQRIAIDISNMLINEIGFNAQVGEFTRVKYVARRFF